MAKYRKKPVVVEAEQWFPLGLEVKGVFLYQPPDVIIGNRGIGPETRYPQEPYWAVTTIHGQVTRVSDGDWIITEPDGVHHYPCKPDIFAATYDPA